MAVDYLYDGSYEGLLTCIYHHYYREAAAGIYSEEGYQPSLVNKYSVVGADPKYSSRVSWGIREKISAFSLRLVYYTYLSSCKGKENLILNYLLLGFRLGAKIDYNHTHPQVQPLHKAARLVRDEAERLLGFLRFSDQGQFLYAALSPDHAILPLLADHFADRLAQERWIIHDLKRKMAVIYDGRISQEKDGAREETGDCAGPAKLKGKRSYRERRWYLTELDHQPEAFAAEEEWYRELWKLYFDKISIASRRNPRLQAQFVPQRYRKHLTEFEK